MHSVIEELKLIVQSGYPLVHLLTHEEERGARLIARAIGDMGGKVGKWSATVSRQAW